MTVTDYSNRTIDRLLQRYAICKLPFLYLFAVVVRIFYAVCVTAKLTFSFTMAHELHIHVVPWSCMHPTLHIPLMMFVENLSLRKQKLLQVFSHIYNTFKYDSFRITIPFNFVLKTPCHLRNTFFSFSVLLKTRFCTDGFFYLVSDSDVIDFPVSHNNV